MEDLPCEMLVAVFGHANATTRAALSCVCGAWRALVVATPRNGKVLPCRDPLQHESECLAPRACAIKYARRLIQQRHWTLLEWMVDRTGPFEGVNTLADEICNVAASDGNLAYLERFYALSNKGKGLLSAAVLYSQLDAIEWLKRKGHKWTEDTYVAAFKGGHPELAVSALACDKSHLEACACAAAKYGHSNVLVQIKERGHKFNLDCACAAAAEGGHLDVIEWLTSHGRK